MEGRTREQTPNPGPFSYLTRRDHTVSLFILLPRPTGENPIYIFYLFIRQKLTPATEGLAHISVKERDQGTGAEIPNPISGN